MCSSSIPYSICAKISVGNETLVVQFPEPIIFTCLKTFIHLRRGENLDLRSMKSAFENRFTGCTFPDTPPPGVDVDMFL